MLRIGKAWPGLARQRRLPAVVVSNSASSECATAPAQRSASAVLDRPAALGVALPDLAAMLGRHGVGQARNRNPVAPKRLPARLAAAITSPGTAQEEHTDP